MTLWETSGGYTYGIALSMDYANNQFGWRSQILNQAMGILRESFYGDIYVEKLNPAHTIEPSATAFNDVNMLLLDDFVEKLFSELDQSILYSGAGMAVGAGVWDLKELRKNLFLNSVEEFVDATANHKRKLLSVIEEFAILLYETVPTESYNILTGLQNTYNMIVITENRDMLHQKSGHRVITREGLKKFPLWLKNKTLIIVGLSADHSGIVKLYRLINRRMPIYVVNSEGIPSYCTGNDMVCIADLNDFFIKLRRSLQ